MALETFHGFKRVSSEEAIPIEGETLERVQEAVLAIAFDVIDFCDENDIDCLLVGGSCLGAVRHGGMIPWDDDVDLAMSRKDFDHFRTLFPGSSLAERYQLAVPGETDDHVILLSQVRAKDTVFRGKDDFGSECGIPVDIFVIENVPNNPVLRKAHCFMSLGMGFLQSARKFAEHPEHYRSLAGDDEGLRKAVDSKVRIGGLLRFLPLQRWTSAAARIYARCDDDVSVNVTIPSGMKHYAGEMQPREVFFPPTTGVFEGREVKLPHDTRAYLTRLYGPDFLSPPPEGEREAHVVLELDLNGFGGSNVR